MKDQIIVDIKDRVGTIILNRPDRRNALDANMVEHFMQALSTLEHEDEVKVILIKAEGKAFCSGVDIDHIKKFQDFTYEENLEDCKRLKNLFYKIYTVPKVVIAQVQGHAVAGGCGLASICDFSLSVPEAKFGYTEVRNGFVSAIVHVFLLRKIGEGKAKELLLEADYISAETAREYGLINKVVPAESLEKEVNQLVQRLIRQNSGHSMARTKEAIAAVQGKPLSDGLDYAVMVDAKARGTQDCKKGVEAFLNKKSINW